MGHGRLPALGVAVMLIAGLPAAASFAQPAAYRVTPPVGWIRSVEADTLIFAAPDEPAGTATLMLLPVKPLERDFDAQFGRERAALERAWTLRDAQQAPPQRGRSAAGEFAASFASYASDRGDRYVAWHALGSQGAFALVVFVAHSSGAFNRHRAAAAEAFNRLALTDEARALTRPSGEPAITSTTAKPVPPAATSTHVASTTARVVGIWSSFRAPGNSPTISSKQIAQAGFGSWWQFRADGTYRQVRAAGRGPTSWDGSVDEGRWSLDGDRLTIQQLTRSPLAALEDPAQLRTKPQWFKAITYRVGFGANGELLLSDPPIDFTLAPVR